MQRVSHPAGLASARPAAPSRGGARRLFRALETLAFAVFLIAAAGTLVLSLGSRFLPVRIYSVMSGSMSPALPTGSLVVDRSTPASALRVGDVITFRRPDDMRTLETHRISAIVEMHGARAFRTRGDANGAPDPWLVPARGAGARVVGTVPYLGYAVAALKLRLPRLLILALAVAVGFAYSLRRIWITPASARR
jgi:signal peptidase I